MHVAERIAITTGALAATGIAMLPVSALISEAVVPKGTEPDNVFLGVYAGSELALGAAAGARFRLAGAAGPVAGAAVGAAAGAVGAAVGGAAWLRLLNI